VSELEVPKEAVKPAELKLARQLIEQQSADQYEPSAYTDELRARIEAEIQKKVEGKQISIAEAATPEVGGGKVIDLMDALRASLQKTEAARASTSRLEPRKGPKRVEQPAKVARKAGRR
jgi:DNA end-binding protein Ku